MKFRCEIISPDIIRGLFRVKTIWNYTRWPCRPHRLWKRAAFVIIKDGTSRLCCTEQTLFLSPFPPRHSFSTFSYSFRKSLTHSWTPHCRISCWYLQKSFIFELNALFTMYDEKVGREREREGGEGESAVAIFSRMSLYRVRWYRDFSRTIFRVHITSAE